MPWIAGAVALEDSGRRALSRLERTQMPKRILGWIICVGMLIVPSALSQQMPVRTFRYISEWKVARKDAGVYAVEVEKTVRPVLQKMMQDGTVFDYGTYITIIKEDDGVTNGYWFEIPNHAALEKVLAELAKVPSSNIGNSATKQHDLLLRSELRRSKASSGTNGYLYFNSTLIQPGKKDQWREWWDKYQKPMYDQFLVDGLVNMYEIDSGEMHTMDPNIVYLIYVSSTADALDKINNAFISRGKSLSRDEAREMANGLDAVVVAGSHRDYFARAMSYANK